MTIRRKISIIVFLAFLFLGGIFYAYDKVYLSHGAADQKVTVAIEKGDNALIVGEKLSKKNVISGKYYLAFYLWKSGQLHNIMAGVYEFAPGVKIPEVARIITGGEIASTRIPITFPEGWTSKQMTARLDANGFSGNDFSLLTSNPPQDLKDEYAFLKEIPNGKSIEGYLFPDTYYFAKDASGRDIVEKMLNNFADKISTGMRNDIATQGKSLFEIVTMASIVESEVRTDEDRKIVAGIFWKRIANGQRLQSDATLEYVLGTNALKHSTAETQMDSPYNTYRNVGLPPGPVSNPGLSSISAALHPTENPYNYFLSDPKTGKTVFAKTFEEHVANKQRFGL